MKLREIISSNDDFQSSVNISFDFGSISKIKSLIPTDTVLKSVEYLLTDVMNPSNRRAKIMTGAYGKGKSHIALTALMAMYQKDPHLYEKLVKGFEDAGFGFASSFREFVTGGIRLLPVIISSSSVDLNHSLLSSLRIALRNASLENLMPKTNYAGAVETLQLWNDKYPDTLKDYEDKSGRSVSAAITALNNFDTNTYDEFVQLYPELTSGSSFDCLDNADALSVYEQVVGDIASYGFSGVYVVYDEFSKYLESNIASASTNDIQLLQDFAEKCCRTSQKQQLHILLIGHKSLENYIDSKLPKEKVDGWRGVSGRFVEYEVRDDINQSYELIADAIVKDNQGWKNWLKQANHESCLERIKARYNARMLFGNARDDQVVYGCYPLHPVSTFLLPRLSEKVAQNERTLFTFLSSSEDKSLYSLLNQDDEVLFITPDAIYDYFEPLLRKEFYTSAVHKIFILTESTLQRVEENSLSARLIKCISLIYIVAQYDSIEPTRQTLVEIYTDCGYSSDSVEEAIDLLVETQSVVYLRRSNSYLKLKESSGVNVDESVSNRSEKMHSVLSAFEILNDFQLGRALYPSRYNEDKEITRYFDCLFIDNAELNVHINNDSKIDCLGDGVIAAILPNSPDDLGSLERDAKNYTVAHPTTVIVVPNDYERIDEVLYKYKAVQELREEANDDLVLREEYAIIQEDYEEIVARFVAKYFRPELKASKYIAHGEQQLVSRRANLSELLSEICFTSFPKTPVIKNETLNKNVLSGAALHSRSKVLRALCAGRIEANLGFVGNGQETAMMRSAFKATGLIERLEDAPEINLAPANSDAANAITTINTILQQESSVQISRIYDALSSGEYGIGMKKGPIILFLALVFRERQDEIQIVRDGVERTLSAELLDDIDAHPDRYSVSVIGWDASMGEYLNDVAELFDCPAVMRNKMQVAESIRRWFVNLPQVTRSAQTCRTCRKTNKSRFEQHKKFFKVLRIGAENSSDLLFTEIPSVFKHAYDDPKLIKAIKQEKKFCDTYASDFAEYLIEKTKQVLMPTAPKEASLCSVANDWIETLPDNRELYALPGLNSMIMKAMKGLTPDSATSISRLAKACTSLRIEDWNDQRYEDYIRVLSEFKDTVEGTGIVSRSGSPKAISITFPDDSGLEHRRVFEPVSCSPRARLLKNEIVNDLNEMGQAITPEEKRQVVFDVLRGIC